MERIRALATIFGLFTLCACGSGDGGELGEVERKRLETDPRMVQLDGIVEGADTLLIPAIYTGFTISVQGTTTRESQRLPMFCSETRCVAQDGSEITLDDLIDPSADFEETGVIIDSRDGFDTITARTELKGMLGLPNGTVTSLPDATSYGIWGKYGYAEVELANGPISGELEGVPFTGNLVFAGSLVAGDATGTNPAGMGSATWTGVAEAASLDTLARHAGTATVTIAELSRPRVRVDIELSTSSRRSPRNIRKAAWVDMPLLRGRFGTGTAGRDFLAGNFHGPDHEEAYGVFDTDTYVGAFGAARTERAENTRIPEGG